MEVAVVITVPAIILLSIAMDNKTFVMPPQSFLTTIVILAVGWGVHHLVSGFRREEKEETIGRAMWRVKKETLRYWSRTKLEEFVEEHLGKGECLTDEELQERARHVIDACIIHDLTVQSTTRVEHHGADVIHKHVDTGNTPVDTGNTHVDTEKRDRSNQEEPKPNQQHRILPGAPLKIKSDIEYPVVFSYQSAQKETLFRLREWLEVRGIKTADGTLVPPGADWR